jgi:hypothetical protein
MATVRFQITVHDSFSVRGRQAVGNLQAELDGLAGTAAGHPLGPAILATFALSAIH